MRIAIYHNQHAGGAARVIEEYLKNAPKTDEFELFMPNTADTGFIDLDRYVKQVHHIPIPGSDSPFGRYRRALAIRSYGRQIARQIDAGGFDVVFANLSFVTQSPEILPYLKTPSVYYCPEPLRAIYDTSPFPEPRTPKSSAKEVFFWGYDRLRAGFDRMAIKRATELFTHSRFTARVLQRTYGVRAAVIHLGVDTKTFRPLSAKRQGFVLSVGAMHPLKGHQFVIEALATLPKSDRPKLVIVGPRGDFGKTLQAYATENDVVLELRLGISTAAVVKTYNQAGLLAAAQYNEPFGLITLEAMATKTPVVAIKEGGLAETVADGRTGLLTRRDPHAFGEAIHRVLSNQKLAATLGSQGFKDVHRRWNWAVTTEKIERLLKQAARTRG